MKTNRLLTQAWLGLALCLGALGLGAQASTVAMVGGSAAADGRPLLMKVRDNSTGPEQEYHYNATGQYAFVGVSYADVTDQCWGGVNETGFAIINSNAWNFDDLVPGPDDDGYIMYVALQTCATINDFQAIMDSTNITGRTRTANYGVVEASGAGAFFEAAAYEYFRFDLDDSLAAPNGYMVRANFAYAGGTYHLGQHRHDRVLALLDSAYAGNFITHGYITQTIQRDLINEETDPYPLPFAGREGLLPLGQLHTHDAINRDISRSAMVLQGIIPGENPLLTTVWALVCEPITILALPLWVQAESVPVQFDSVGGSSLNLRAQEIRDYLYDPQWANDAIDTWRLVDDRGQGWLPFLTEIEDMGFYRGDSIQQVWRTTGVPAPAVVAAFQNNLATGAYIAMENWGPPAAPEVTMVRLPNNQVQLNWSPVTVDVFNRPMVISAYTIFTSNQSFYTRNLGDSLTTVAAPPITLTAQESHKFYQVRCHP